jgi:hypothetical protein
MDRIKRPAVTILSDRSLIPPANLIAPPPNRFSHATTRAQPYFWSEEALDEPPAGTFEADLRVLLLRDDGRYARVVDEHGLYVLVELAGLSPIS